jgi:hypothetical protein
MENCGIIFGAWGWRQSTIISSRIGTPVSFVLVSPAFLGFLPDAGRGDLTIVQGDGDEEASAWNSWLGFGVNLPSPHLHRDKSFHVVRGLQLSLVPNYRRAVLRLPALVWNLGN